MTVSEAVRKAVPVFTTLPDADSHTIRAELIGAGIPIDLAADIVEFLPLAAARAMMDGMGIQFADEYIRQTRQGRVIGQRQLREEPVYQEGLAVARELSGIGDEVFLALVRRSPEYRAVSKAMDSGANPAELSCGPPTLIANDGDRRSFGELPVRRGKSWWRFWK